MKLLNWFEQILSNRTEVPAVWFAAFLFPFKLFTVCATTWLLILYVMLPPNHPNPQTGFNEAWHLASNHFYFDYFDAFFLSIYCFLAAGVQVIGGLIQLVDYSRKSAFWSIAFGIIALIFGIFLTVCVPEPGGIH